MAAVLEVVPGFSFRDASTLGSALSAAAVACLYNSDHSEPCDLLYLAHGSYAFPHAAPPTMRKTLRRSCDPCARSKLRCDLLLPQCSRCQKKSPLKTICSYANAPLSSVLTDNVAKFSTSSSPEADVVALQYSSNPGVLLSNPGTESFDPFDSYPQTRLPRALVQRLIQHCTSFPCDTLTSIFKSSFRQSCRQLLSSTIPLTCKRHRTLSWSPGSHWLWQIQLFSMFRCKQHL